MSIITSTNADNVPQEKNEILPFATMCMDS